MQILGIDPGLGTTGWAIVERNRERLRIVAHGAIRTAAAEALPLRLLTICNGIRELLRENAVDGCAIEDIFVAKDARAAIALGQARGAAVLGAAMSGVAVDSYAAREVKQSVTGNGRASKEQVSYMVQALLALPDPLKPVDCADAAAIALCHLNRAGTSVPGRTVHA